MSLPPPPTPSGRLMIIATLSVKPGKEQLIQDLLKDAQKRANRDEEPDTFTYRFTRRLDKKGAHLPVFVVIEEYGVNGLEVHMAGPLLQALMETFKDSDVLDGELVIDYLDEI
ncbi:hypothetical protein F5877DRAFT_67035 [Lentinula edodes]|nr:hypothetical protein F5877DRAFT_67035 [Lentinula edodes]